MAGMTGASSNIGWLETLPVARCWTECPRSTRLGSVRLYTRGCIVFSVYSGVIQEPIYNSKYNGAIYSGVYKWQYLGLAAFFAALHSGRQASAYRGTCHSACTSSIRERERRLPCQLFHLLRQQRFSGFSFEALTPG